MKKISGRLYRLRGGRAVLMSVPMTKSFHRGTFTTGCFLFLVLAWVLQIHAQAGGDIALEWRFKMQRDAKDVPATSVSLRVNNDMQFVIEPKAIAAFHVLARKDFAAHGVPEHALTACAGWWAGGGEEYYALFDAHRKQVLVFHRSVDEGAAASHFKVVRRLPTTVTKVR